MTSQQPQCSWRFAEHGPQCRQPVLPNQDKCLFHAPPEAKGTAAFDEAILWKMGQDDYNFSGSVFPGTAVFFGAQFTGDADFGGAQFSGEAHFRRAQFSGDAYFNGAQFTGAADFSRAQFTGNAGFTGARFSGEANFREAKFCGDAGFYLAKFSGKADFTVARFSGEAYFRETKFPKGVSFRGAEWKQWTIFERVEFGPGTHFPEAVLGKVVFRSSNLRHCSFRSANGIESAEFDNITWDRRYGRDSIADELAARDSNNSQVTFADAERVYLHLRRSYQTRLDYPRSREFYYGEMEMRRLAMRKRLHRWFSLTHWFYMVSGYGQRWLQAALWLGAAILLVFPLLYAFSGLVTAEGETLLQIVLGWQGLSAFWDGLKVVGESILYSINVALLRPSDFAQPLSAWGRFFQALELVLGPTFITILILAIREQFRR